MSLSRHFEITMAASNPRAHLRVVRQPAPAAPSLSDDEVVAGFVAREVGAAEMLHDRVRPTLDRMLVRLVGRSDPEIEDLAQNALIEIVTSLARFQPGTALRAWAATITARVVYKSIRRRKLERRIFAREDVFEPDAHPNGSVDAARALRLRSVLGRIRAHLVELDERKSWAFVLHDVLGHDVREVAEIMDASIASTQQRLARGRRELHLRLANDPELADIVLDLGGGE